MMGDGNGAPKERKSYWTGVLVTLIVAISGYLAYFIDMSGKQVKQQQAREAHVKDSTEKANHVRDSIAQVKRDSIAKVQKDSLAEIAKHKMRKGKHAVPVQSKSLQKMQIIRR